MFVEDILLAINNKLVPTNPKMQPVFGGLLDSKWHRDFITSVSARARDGRAWSSKQNEIVLKLIAKVSPYFSDYDLASASEIKQLLAFPNYRQPPYESAQVRREARYLGDNLLGLRGNMDRGFIARIKALAGQKVRFDWSHKIWIIRVQYCNLLDVQTLLHEYRFSLDQIATDYLRLCSASIDRVTTVSFVENDRSMLIVNVCVNDVLAGWITAIAEGITL